MFREGLCYDDVLLVPQYSSIESRSSIDVSVELGPLKFKQPIIPANMKNIVGKEMAIEIIKSGGLAILHRFIDIQEQINIAKYIVDTFGSNNFAISIGVKPGDRETISRFKDVGVRIICIDIAHGDSKLCEDMVSWIKKYHPEQFIIAGNVCTAAGTKRLWNAGADVCKIGVGPGSICSTRIETGNGVPQLTALIDAALMQKQMREKSGIKNGFYFIADGGIKKSGDCLKALIFADMVMAGNLFAGCDEAPGNRVSINGISYKEYVGSSTHKTNHIEGVAALVPSTTKYETVLTKLLEGIKSGCSYQGVNNLTELKENPEFIRITNSGLIESHPHNVLIK